MDNALYPPSLLPVIDPRGRRTVLFVVASLCVVYLFWKKSKGNTSLRPSLDTKTVDVDSRISTWKKKWKKFKKTSSLVEEKIFVQQVYILYAEGLHIVLHEGNGGESITDKSYEELESMGEVVTQQEKKLFQKLYYPLYEIGFWDDEQRTSITNAVENILFDRFDTYLLSIDSKDI